MVIRAVRIDKSSLVDMYLNFDDEMTFSDAKKKSIPYVWIELKDDVAIPVDGSYYDGAIFTAPAIEGDRVTEDKDEAFRIIYEMQSAIVQAQIEIDEAIENAVRLSQ